MRETRNAQSSIFDFYSEHEHGVMLANLSGLLDSHATIVDALQPGLVNKNCLQTGRSGLSVESVLRCLLLKSILQVSYKQLAFYLSDSATYRTFARSAPDQQPSRSGLQSTIRKRRPQTLQQIHECLCTDWHQQELIKTDKIRIDSTVVEADIATPSDSGLLNDSIRVLSRQLALCHRKTGLKVRITDQRAKAEKLRFAIF